MREYMNSNLVYLIIFILSILVLTIFIPSVLFVLLIWGVIALAYLAYMSDRSNW